MAKDSGRPIVPIIVDIKKSWKFKNWHTFYIGKPFSKMKVVIGKPLCFDKNEGVEVGTKKIEQSLNEINRIAGNHE